MNLFGDLDISKPMMEAADQMVNALFETIQGIKLYRDGEYQGPCDNISCADDYAEFSSRNVYIVIRENGMRELWGSSFDNKDEIENNWIRNYPGYGDISIKHYLWLEKNGRLDPNVPVPEKIAQMRNGQ